MMTEGPGAINGKKTFKEKINEPILNAKQIFAMCMTILYEVISNLVYAVITDDPNWIYIFLNIGIGIIIIVFIGLLRAAYPEEVPDKTIWAAFWSIWKYLVDTIIDPTNDNDTKMNILEKGIQWFVREWDIAYQEKMKEQTAYYKEKLNAKIKKLEGDINASSE